MSHVIARYQNIFKLLQIAIKIATHTHDTASTISNKQLGAIRYAKRKRYTSQIKARDAQAAQPPSARGQRDVYIKHLGAGKSQAAG
jgi:hypothetical protein